MSIKMPSEEEKLRSIRYILDKAIPKEEHFRIRIFSLISKVGIRNLFFGTWNCVFLALLGGITFVLLIVLPSAVYRSFIPVCLLQASPVLYALLYFLTMWKERQAGLYEIKMTCYYTIRELIALRMVFFGGISAFADIIFMFVIRHIIKRYHIEIVLSLFQMLGISLSALFLYGAATLFILVRAKGRYQWCLPVVWCSVSVAFLILNIDVLGFLMKVTNTVAILSAIFSVLLFFTQLEYYLNKNRKGGIHYAFN